MVTIEAPLGMIGTGSSVILDEILTWSAMCKTKGNSVMVYFRSLVSEVLLVTVFLQGEVHRNGVRAFVSAIALDSISLRHWRDNGLNPLTIIAAYKALRWAHLVLLLALHALVHAPLIVQFLRWRL